MGQEILKSALMAVDEINKATVGNLKVVWTHALGGIEGGGIWPHGGLEGTPIVEDGFMYVTDGWGAVYKLDATEGPDAGAGDRATWVDSVRKSAKPWSI